MSWMCSLLCNYYWLFVNFVWYVVLFNQWLQFWRPGRYLKDISYSCSANAQRISLALLVAPSVMKHSGLWSQNTVVCEQKMKFRYFRRLHMTPNASASMAAQDCWLLLNLQLPKAMGFSEPSSVHWNRQSPTDVPEVSTSNPKGTTSPTAQRPRHRQSQHKRTDLPSPFLRTHTTGETMGLFDGLIKPSLRLCFSSLINTRPRIWQSWQLEQYSFTFWFICGKQKDKRIRCKVFLYA